MKKVLSVLAILALALFLFAGVAEAQCTTSCAKTVSVQSFSSYSYVQPAAIVTTVTSYSVQPQVTEILEVPVQVYQQTQAQAVIVKAIQPAPIVQQKTVVVRQAPVVQQKTVLVQQQNAHVQNVQVQQVQVKKVHPQTTTTTVTQQKGLFRDRTTISTTSR
mgnify:CR=1 FL=1